MKRVIRKCCYETNSSSQHSILITKDDVHLTEKDFVHDLKSNNPYPDNYVYIWNGKWDLRNLYEGFGRYPFRILTTFEDKFKYAMCEFMGYLYEDDPQFVEYYEMFKEIAADVLPEFTDFKIDTKDVDIYLDENGNEILHKNLIYDHWDRETNKSVYLYKTENGELKNAILDEENYYETPNIGVIDHQSFGLLKNFLKEKNIDLKEFLTNKRYCIVITGDEYDDWPILKKSGLIDNEFIIEEFDTSSEDIEYMEWKKEQERLENEESNS